MFAPMLLRGAGVLVLAVLVGGCARLLGANELSFEGKGGCSGSASCGGEAGSSSAVLCGNNHDCTPHAWDEPKVCLEGACVALKNDSECSFVMGAENLQVDVPAFLFGIFVGLPLEESSYARSSYLAVREFSSQGLKVSGEAALPIAVVCHPYPKASLEHSLEHLVGTLGVKAIISGLDQLDLERSFERVQEAYGDVFFLSPGESEPRLSSLEDEGLLWEMLPGSLELARPLLPLVTRIEEYTRRAQPSDEQRPIRLALIESNYPADADLGAYLDRHLVFNGAPPHENAPTYYLRLKLESDRVNAAATDTDAFDALRAFEPDVIVVAAGDEFVRRMMLPLEQNRPAWQAAPFYVFSPLTPMLPNIVERVPGLERRILGVGHAAPEDDTLHRAFLSSLASEFPLANGEGADNFYDATYFLLYAAAAAGKVPQLTGRELARGMTRLIGGQRFDVGVTHIPSVLRHLQDENSTLALHGTLGPPTFDAETGSRHGNGSVWCMSLVDGVLSMKTDVLRYDPGSASLRGEVPCIDGF
jgi:hypothetical protein